MFDIHAERERRIMQFTRHLKLMHHRAHIEGHGCCFLIFNEDPSNQSDDTDHLEESNVLTAAFSEYADSSNILTDVPGPLRETASADRSWRPEDSFNRFLQFSFERNWFCMDLPCDTLFKPEAEKIMRDRSGFFYLRDLPQFTLYGEDVEGYDPFRKIYLYGDERRAAEDTAYIFFDVWKFPLESQLLVTASAFGDGPSFERDEPIG